MQAIPAVLVLFVSVSSGVFAGLASTPDVVVADIGASNATIPFSPELIGEKHHASQFCEASMVQSLRT